MVVRRNESEPGGEGSACERVNAGAGGTASECENAFPPPEVFVLLRRQLRRLVADAHAVEDLVQETLLRAIRHHDRLRDRAARDGWLLRIAYHVAMDWHRRRARAYATREEDGTVPAEEIAAPREETALARDECLRWSQRLRRALSTLCVRDRGLVLGHYYVGFSCRQLAERSGLSEANVKVRLHRARRWLRRVLPEFAAEEGSTPLQARVPETSPPAPDPASPVPERRPVVELARTGPRLRYAPSVRRRALPRRDSESA